MNDLQFTKFAKASLLEFALYSARKIGKIKNYLLSNHHSIPLNREMPAMPLSLGLAKVRLKHYQALILTIKQGLAGPNDEDISHFFVIKECILW